MRGPLAAPQQKKTDDAREDIEGWEWPCAEETSEEAREPWSETEKSSDECLQQHDREDTHVLSLLYKGNVAERNRQEQREKKHGAAPGQAQLLQEHSLYYDSSGRV